MVTRQYDVFRNTKAREAFPYLLVVQHDLLAELPVRVVVPLASRRALGGRPISRLNPVFEVAGGEVVMLTQLLGAVAAASLRQKVQNLGDERAAIISALDVLFSGV